MIKPRIAAFCALSLTALGVASTAVAGTVSTGKETKALTETVKESCISGDLGVTVVSEYISRGVVNENQGVIAQPYLDLYFKLYEGTGFLNKVTANLGFWSSIHSARTAAAPGTQLGSWYEFDYTPGLTFTFAKNFNATLSYFEFDFISSEGRVGNANLSLSYDDSDLLGAFAIHPHVAIFKSLFGNPVGVPGANGGWYFEAGVAPSYTFVKGGTYPVTLSLPISAGFGDNKFYGGQTFGYISGGTQVSVPLAFIPSCYGKWTLAAGYTYYYLGHNAAVASAPGITDGERSQHVFQGSVGLAF